MDEVTVNSSSKTKDPLKWFGLLVPNSLKQTQGSFLKALEVSVECANIQNEIDGTIARKKFLMRQLKKMSNVEETI